VTASRPLNLLWLQSGGCGGCTLSLLNADSRDLLATLAGYGLNVVWHPALSEASLGEVTALLDDCLAGRTPLDVLCIEGALLRAPFHRSLGEPVAERVRRLAAMARHVVAVGSCAAFGGVTAAGCNPTDAAGLQFDGATPGGLLGVEFRAAGGLPVVNIAGCPTHPNWVIETLAALAAGQLDEAALDAFRRPRLYADHLVHHGCTRNEYYEFKASAQHPSQLGCLMENLGCKGTQAHADCNIRLWNGEGSCIRGGYACVSCTEPGFEEPGHPFMETPKVAGIPVGLPTDMPKAWFVALASLSKSATPRRVRENAHSDHQVVTPAVKKGRK
jgi:ferredoxin hydrogenase small subunit